LGVLSESRHQLLPCQHPLVSEQLGEDNRGLGVGYVAVLSGAILGTLVLGAKYELNDRAGRDP